MKEIHEILVAPHITEDSTKKMVDARTGVRQYVFKVAMDASKSDIKEAIEELILGASQYANSNMMSSPNKGGGGSGGGGGKFHVISRN